MLIVGRRHLIQVLRIYIEHYTRERPNRGLGLRPPWILLRAGIDRKPNLHRSLGEIDLAGGCSMSTTYN
ncbi:MAG: transposase [Actinomycetota bacterium]